MDNIKILRCPGCNANKVDVKNIGFVHSKWEYSGIIKTTLSNVHGDGKTFDDKMLTFKETELESVFLSLNMEVCRCFPDIVVETLFTTQINETEEEEQDAFDDIDDNIDELSLVSSRVKTSNINKCKTTVVRHLK